MIEVAVLFFIVIVIVLCILSIMYKCTDGTMVADDFSTGTCFKLGDPTKKDDDKAPSVADAGGGGTSSPLLAGSGMSGSLFGGNIVDDTEVDYSPYVDYFRISNDGVRVNEYDVDMDEDGIPDFTDSIEVRVSGPGECAKICYEKEKQIDDYECNAFKMKPGSNECTLYWSQSKSGVTETEPVYRLKVPRKPATHAAEAINTYKNHPRVEMFSDIEYQNLMFYSDYITYFQPGNGPKSLFIPGYNCIKTYKTSEPVGEFKEYSLSQPDLSNEEIGTLFIGTINSLGECVYPTAELEGWLDCETHDPNQEQTDYCELDNDFEDRTWSGSFWGKCLDYKFTDVDPNTNECV
jgi:hypothetical protein